MRVFLVLMFVPACAGEGLLGVNEIASLGSSGVTNPAGEPADWVELLNRDQESRALTGWSFEVGGQSHTFPELTLAPDELLVVLCDEDVEMSAGELYIPFLLPDEAFELRVRDAEGRLVQELSVPTLPPDHSFARVPDVSNSWQLQELPTPGAHNGGR